MLNLTRKLNQTVLLHLPPGLPNEVTIEVKVVGIDANGVVKLGCNAPDEVTIVRPEINDPDRGDRSKVPVDKLIQDLFQDCWRQGRGFQTYAHPKWMELQAALLAKGIVV